MVRAEIEKKKATRYYGNKRQRNAYNSMLDHVDKRATYFHSKDKRPIKTHMHEKEREFFDILRLIIQNGYQIIPTDIGDILSFI